MTLLCSCTAPPCSFIFQAKNRGTQSVRSYDAVLAASSSVFLPSSRNLRDFPNSNENFQRGRKKVPFTTCIFESMVAFGTTSAFLKVKAERRTQNSISFLLGHFFGCKLPELLYSKEPFCNLVHYF